VTTLQPAPGKVRITAEEFGRMAEIGLFEGRHVELLDGELYEVTKNPPHNVAVGLLADQLVAILPRGEYHVREEKPVGPWESWSPEPDVAVVRGPRTRYARQDPQPDDVILLAEVCDTSEQDRTKKLAGYAAAGVPVYWILDLNARRLEVYSGPAGDTYQSALIVPETEAVDVALDGRSLGQITVADFLPRA
jgi:Uma2 family endonuclease